MGFLFMTTLNSTARSAGQDVAVRGPRTLPQRIAAERIAIGVPGDYKPCIVKLASGELLVIAFHQEKREGGKIREKVILFRSQDGGRTWPPSQEIDLLGREPYFSLMDDGTLFVTSHMHDRDTKTEDERYIYTYLHRSNDDGRSWQRLRVTADAIPGCPPTPPWILYGRNLLKLADGSILFGLDVVY